MTDEHEHDHEDHDHGHAHGAVDPAMLSTERGIRAVKWSCVGMLVTSFIQAWVVWRSGSVSLLADAVHNFGDAATSLPLWLAFSLMQLKPNKRFTYGYGRVEDVAGVFIVLVIFASAVVAVYASAYRFSHPRSMEHLGAVAAAALIGAIGNGGVAWVRIKVGREIGSAALIADGEHTRSDALGSLAVLLGVGGAVLGYPRADPIVGFVIAAMILHIVWDTGKVVFMRLLDGVDPDVVDEIVQEASEVPGVREVGEVRVRWSGHRMHAELNVAVTPKLTVEEGHAVAMDVRRELMSHLKHLFNVTVHVDSLEASGERHHAGGRD